jgi:predicted metal-dependent phosphoesterase TrpH
MVNLTFVDMHTHTTASDGMCSPADNVRQALQAGLAAVAITDHDTVSGIEEARMEGERIGIEVVPGVEISTMDRGVDIHILGYYLDYQDPVLLQRLSRLRDMRNDRNSLILNRLNELGIHITMDEVNQHLISHTGDDQSIGRPHIANVLVARGIVDTVADAFELYLGKGRAAYVNLPRISPREALDWVREAGGKAVLAHPGLYNNEDIVHDIIQLGIHGIEVYHSDHTEAQRQYYYELATRHGLLITAGSDYHGSRGGVIFHGAIGSERIHTEVLEQLKSPE